MSPLCGGMEIDMNDNVTKRRLKILIDLLFFAVIGLLLYLFFKYVFGFAAPLLVGFALALCVEPAVRYFSELGVFNRKIWGFVLTAAVWGILIFALVKLGGVLYRQSASLMSFLQSRSGDLFGGIRSFLDSALSGISQPLALSVMNYLDNFSSSLLDTVLELLGGVGGILSSVPSMVMSLFVAVVSSVFFSIDLPKVKGVFFSMIPARHIVDFFEMKGFVIEKTLKILRAYIIIIAITSVELYIGFSVLHVEYGLLFSVMIALLDALPIIGTGTFLIPWGLFEILTGNPSLGIGLLVLLGVISIVRELITPRLVGKQIGLNPLITLVGMYVGMQLFGFLGLFLSPIILMFVKNLSENGKINLRRRETVEDPAPLSR